MTLEETLLKLPPGTLYGSCIHGLLTIKKPMATICAFILDCHTNDPKKLVAAIGEDTLKLVKQYYYDYYTGG